MGGTRATVSLLVKETEHGRLSKSPFCGYDISLLKLIFILKNIVSCMSFNLKK